MERLLKVADVTERTRLSRSLVYELIASGDLPSIAIGRTRRVREADLDAWVQAKAGEQATAATAGA
jgi:excisionase family DNA binding protein